MDKGSAVREMFDRIAGRYDLANTVMTGGVDALWRRQAAGNLMLAPDARVLDLCCGTGALTRDLAHRVPYGRVTGVDFSPHMLAVARQHEGPGNISYHEADVLALPFGSATFDAAAMAFSMRNVTDITACLREVARVLKPGGSFVNLEVGKPSSPLLPRAFFAYFYGVIPFLGGLVGGDRAAYRYLPQSLINFPDQRTLAALFKDNGFPHTRCVSLVGGVANLHIGTTGAAAVRGEPVFATSMPCSSVRHRARSAMLSSSSFAKSLATRMRR
jgi:demethylmenaquinone methyltransferase/2-methoxy-6-polyprenyl-1,4-benzoquinol methylase